MLTPYIGCWRRTRERRNPSPGTGLMNLAKPPAEAGPATDADTKGRSSWLAAALLALFPFAILAALAILDSFIR